MAQGDASIYPILPISASIMVFSFLLSIAISLLFDYLYDLYLVRYSDEKNKSLIQDRVKSDFTIVKNFFKSNKIEKFDDEEAKKRLTIIHKLINDKVYSKENKPFLDEMNEKKAQKAKLNNEKLNGKVVELNETKSDEKNIPKTSKTKDETTSHKPEEKDASKKIQELKPNNVPEKKTIEKEVNPVMPVVGKKNVDKPPENNQTKSVASTVEKKTVEKIPEKEIKTVVPVAVGVERKPVEKSTQNIEAKSNENSKTIEEVKKMPEDNVIPNNNIKPPLQSSQVSKDEIKSKQVTDVNSSLIKNDEINNKTKEDISTPTSQAVKLKETDEKSVEHHQVAPINSSSTTSQAKPKNENEALDNNNNSSTSKPVNLNVTTNEIKNEEIKTKQVSGGVVPSSQQVVNKSTTVHLEMKQNTVRKSSARLVPEEKKFTFPKATTTTTTTTTSKETAKKVDDKVENISTNQAKKTNKNPFVDPNSDLLESLGANNPLNKGLAKEFIEKKTISIEERLKLNSKNKLNPKELVANKNKQNDKTKNIKFKYDSGEELDEESEESNTKKETVIM